MKMRKGPDGIHLFNRQTGVNILLDEVIPPSSSWSTTPRQVSIALTNACDLTCPHCYASKQKATLDSNKVKRWISELNTHDCFGVGFGGGEPTLHPDLVNIFKFIRTQTNIAITMTTHGHRLSDKLLTQLDGNVHYIRVSMDGINETYESIRGRPFNNLLKVLHKLKNIVPFGINYVVNAKTVGQISEASQLAEDTGASEFLLLPEEGIGKGTNIDSKSLTNLKAWVNNYRGSMRLAISSQHADVFPTTSTLSKEPEWLAYAHIDAGGNLKRTSFDHSGLEIDNKGVMSAFKKLNKNFVRGLE